MSNNNDSNVSSVSSKNIVDTAAANGSFHTLGKALETKPRRVDP